MTQKYYLDSCIWRDYLENRADRFRPLGEWAFRLIKIIIEREEVIYYSAIVEEEMGKVYVDRDIRTILSIVPHNLLIKLYFSARQLKEAFEISRNIKIPVNDAIHAILARDNDAILVSRDKHFYELTGAIVKKPEELI